MAASSVPTFWIAVDHSTVTGQQHLRRDVLRETVDEESHSISGMCNIFEYVKHKSSLSMPYGAMSVFFRGCTTSRTTAGTQRSCLKGCKETDVFLSGYTITFYGQCDSKERLDPLQAICLPHPRFSRCLSACAEFPGDPAWDRACDGRLLGSS